MLPVLVFSRTGCVLCVLLPVSATKIRHWLNRLFVRIASSGLFQNWVCDVCMACAHPAHSTQHRHPTQLTKARQADRKSIFQDFFQLYCANMFTHVALNSFLRSYVRPRVGTDIFPGEISRKIHRSDIQIAGGILPNHPQNNFSTSNHIWDSGNLLIYTYSNNQSQQY